MEKVLIPSGNKTVDRVGAGGVEASGGVILINDGFSLSARSAVVERFCLKRENIEILHPNRAPVRVRVCVCAALVDERACVHMRTCVRTRACLCVRTVQVKFHYESALII